MKTKENGPCLEIWVWPKLPGRMIMILSHTNESNLIYMQTALYKYINSTQYTSYNGIFHAFAGVTLCAFLVWRLENANI